MFLDILVSKGFRFSK